MRHVPRAAPTLDSVIHQYCIHSPLKMEFTGNLPLLGALLVFPIIFFISRRNVLALLETREDDNITAEVDPDAKASDHEHDAEEEVDEGNEEPKNIMQSENNTLQPPKDDPFTLAQLQEFDGSNPEKPIYVSIKGMFTSSYLLLRFRCSCLQ